MTPLSITHWILPTLVVVLLGALLSGLAPALAPFLAGVVLAYMVNPIMQRMRGWGLPAALAAMVVMLLTVSLAVGLVLLMVPVLTKQWPLIREQLPVLLNQSYVWLQPWLAQAGVHIDASASWSETLRSWLMEHEASTWPALWNSLQSGGNALLLWLGYAFITPVVMFYMLIDGSHWVQRTWCWAPTRWQTPLQRWWQEVDLVLGQYLRGQWSVMATLAVFYAVSLRYAVGLDVGISVGVFTGLAMIVPYVGFAVGFVLAVLAAALQFQALEPVLWVLAIYGVGQLVESVWLTPHWVGQRIGLHPLAVILALVVFAQLFGFFGILLALPLGAMLAVTLRHVEPWLRETAWYRQS